MTCRDARRELAQVQDEVAVLSGPVREHVSLCPACAAYAGGLQVQEERLAGAFGWAEPPADLAYRVTEAVLRPKAAARGPVWHLYASAVAIATVILAVIAVFTGPHRDQDEGGLGTVVMASGGAVIVRGSEVLGGVEGRRTRVGDLLITASNGLARLRLDDGSCLRLQPDTIVHVAAGPDGSGRPVCLSLRQGGLQALVPATSVCAIDTPSGTAVMQGAQLCLVTDGLQTQVAVREGEARFVNSEGQVVACSAEYTTARVGSPPMTPCPGASYRNECGEGSLPSEPCRR